MAAVSDFGYVRHCSDLLIVLYLGSERRGTELPILVIGCWAVRL